MLEFFDLLIDTQKENNFLNEKYIKLKNILDAVSKDLTKNIGIQFSSLFARIAFLSNRHQLNKRIAWHLQQIRILSNQILRKSYQPSQSEYDNAFKSLAESISKCYQVSMPSELISLLPMTDFFAPLPKTNNKIIAKVRVEVVAIDWKNEILYCITENNDSEEKISVKYNLSTINDEFTSSIQKIWEGAQLNLLEVLIDENGTYIPKYLILEPDYLIDVSGISECFQMRGTQPLSFLLKKIEAQELTLPQHLGNLANFFLDEVLNQTDENPADFKNSFLKTFQLYPIEYTSLKEIEEDSDFKTFMNNALVHFTNVKRTVEQDFVLYSINRENCYIEPSFFSERYGLQGRLDLLHQRKDRFDIIELKSGKSVPNSDMWANHRTQTQLYRLMLQSVFESEPRQINPAIFYSAVNNNNLRFSPPSTTEEKKILNIRNLIVANEFALAMGEKEARRVLEQLRENEFQSSSPFALKSVVHIQKILQGANILEKKYFFAFINFVAKEHQLAKIGDLEYGQGLSALWAKSFEEKAKNFEILYDLQIIDNQSSNNNPCLIFKRTNPQNDFVNFREGDIGVLYPRDMNRVEDLPSEDEQTSIEITALQNQIFKCVIEKIEKEIIIIRLRFKQKNQSFFEKYNFWAIEHDFLEHSFNAMYRGLFGFLECTSQEKKELILGLKAPQTQSLNFDWTELQQTLNTESAKIVQKALQAQDYFLIVGPPGTGKTSRLLKTLVKELYHQTDSNILLIAYTNRAVDEICEAISEHHLGSFIRIGSELSTKQELRENLLDKIALKAKNRTELKDKILQTRIFVGTLASISGKNELFNLKKFNVAIIDEASQILEPQLIGILHKVEKFILIGDQKQLPAIAQQAPELSVVKDQELLDMGLINRRNSYFERLFYLCQKNQWEWAYDMLTHQGRMHAEIMAFANEFFYEGKLKLIPADWQIEALDLKVKSINSNQEGTFENNLIGLLATKRLLFFPTPISHTDIDEKVNEFEALKVIEIIQAIKFLYASNGKDFVPEKTIGVITPYRNQIAKIRYELEKAKIPDYERITIDTVERYQGSQRDIIIISFCVNNALQLRNLVSLADDGITDRKLNVAITRARQQMIFLGNAHLLRKNYIYNALIEFVRNKTKAVV
ncbi:MAG: AAA domain-containing protein [Thermoflexibacter sp.]|nr:AAA domain-containing protein [Thermoflexibacter sp.]